MSCRRRAHVVAAALLLLGCADPRHRDAPGGAASAPFELLPGAAPLPSSGPLSTTELARHVGVLRQKIARLNGKFAIVVDPPFVIVGDLGEERLRSVAAETIRWTRDKLKQDFFTQDPARILDVWLFKDAESYTRNVPALSGKEPRTPYGYYSSEDGALYMNIGTGLGTLVHELVHPYVEANFPGCPPWLNEGLGSLFEQCGERDGHIVGFTNWRLRELKAAIPDGRVPSFRDLTAMDAYAFYGPGSSVHYAASRYLLYYLQERGLLVRYYRSFYEGREADATGYATFSRVLGEDDMAAFERRWVDFVMKLSFP